MWEIDEEMANRFRATLSTTYRLEQLMRRAFQRQAVKEDADLSAGQIAYILDDEDLDEPPALGE